ncbi:MAG: hypothetical protein R3B82_18445 [Sandaracinaceae bacterium]
MVGIAPLTVTTRAMKKGDAFADRHPCGLPKKIARQAWVTRDHAASWFETNLDTFGGNSGSPVFHASSHEVCGILVRGARDFVKRPEGCYVATTFPLEGGGEAVTRVSEWAGAVKQIKTQRIADVASISAPVPRTGDSRWPWPRREATRSIDRARPKRFLEEHFTAKEMQSWLGRSDRARGGPQEGRGGVVAFNTSRAEVALDLASALEQRKALRGEVAVKVARALFEHRPHCREDIEGLWVSEGK